VLVFNFTCKKLILKEKTPKATGRLKNIM